MCFLRMARKGAGDCRLDVAEHGVHPVEGRMACSLASRSRRHRYVPATGIGDAAKAFEPVGDDGGTFGDDLLGDASSPAFS